MDAALLPGDLLIDDPVELLETGSGAHRGSAPPTFGRTARPWIASGADADPSAVSSHGVDPEMSSRQIGSPLARLGARGVHGSKLSSSLAINLPPPLDARPEDGATSDLVPPQDQWAEGEVRDGILITEKVVAPPPKEAVLQDPQDAVVDTTITPRGDYGRESTEGIPEPGPELGGGNGVMGNPGGNFATDFTVNGKQEFSFDPTIPNKFEYGVDFHDSIDPYDHTGKTNTHKKALKDHKEEFSRMHHAHKAEE